MVDKKGNSVKVGRRIIDNTDLFPSQGGKWSRNRLNLDRTGVEQLMTLLGGPLTLCSLGLIVPLSSRGQHAIVTNNPHTLESTCGLN